MGRGECGRPRGRAPLPGDTPAFPWTGAGTGAREPGLPRRGAARRGELGSRRGRGLQPLEPRARGAPRAGSRGAASPTQTTRRRGELSFIALSSSPSPTALRGARAGAPGAEVPGSFLSGLQRRESGGGRRAGRRGSA